MNKSDKAMLSTEDALRALRELEIVLGSLDRIGSYYAGKDVTELQRETLRFLKEWNVIDRIVVARRVLISALGPDKMNQIEGDQQDLRYWSRPGDLPERL